jgi:uncharacterized protein (TIGR02246 family)
MHPAGLLMIGLSLISWSFPAPAATPAVTATERQADEAAIRKLGRVWQDSWNARDAAGLASIMDEGVVFVSVLGPDTPGQGRGGREAFEAGHAAILKTAFANSSWTTEDVTVVRWLRPDIAVAHVTWRTTGDRVPHIKAGDPRRGMFTWVVEKQQGQWRVVASQNTEVVPPLPAQ